MRRSLGLLLALCACSAAPAPQGPSPRPSASTSEAEQDRHTVEVRTSADASWVQRQQERQGAFLSFQSCFDACKGDVGCQERCGSPLKQRARCVPCSINGRCQILSENEVGTLDCCLPITDERGCIRPSKP